MFGLLVIIAQEIPDLLLGEDIQADGRLVRNRMRGLWISAARISIFIRSPKESLRT